MRIRFVAGRVAKVSMAVLLIVAASATFAGCGGGASPVPSATGLPMPSGLTDEQREAVAAIPDPGNSAKPLARLVGTRDLTADELTKTLHDDPAFAALEADAVERGFGRAVAAIDLAYDNGVTVTIAELAGSGDGATDGVGGAGGDALRFAFRSSAPRPHYLLVEVDRDGKRITAHDANGSVSLDLATGETTFGESPTAHHSCSFLHCFHTALMICMDIPVYGAVVGVTCEGCIELLASGVGAPLGAPVCLTCLATVAATLGASAWVCGDDPCGFCHSDSCGTAEPASEDRCSDWVTPPDPLNERRSGISRVNYGYACNGIETGGWPSNDKSYESTQCQQWSASGGLVTPCPHGCAPPLPGDGSSRACMASPSACDPSACSGETAVGVQSCTLRPDDGKSVVIRDYQVRGCIPAANGETCGTTTVTRVIEECPGACSDDGRTCQVPQCDAATCAREEPAGAQVCRLGSVVQPTRRYFCNLTRTACDSVVRDELIQACPAGCAADGTHCRGPDGGRTDTSTVTGKVLAALSPDAYDLCPTCTFRLRGAVDTFTVTSAANASFSLADVPSGSYRVERMCGSTWLPGHGPWDALLGYAAVTVPTTGTVDVLLPKCPSQQ